MNEKLTLAEAAELEGVAENTIRRWAEQGLMGGKVRLELRRKGGRLFVTPEDIARFYQRIDEEKRRPKQRLGRSPTEEKRSRKQARQILERAGFRVSKDEQ